MWCGLPGVIPPLKRGNLSAQQLARCEGPRADGGWRVSERAARSAKWGRESVGRPAGRWPGRRRSAGRLRPAGAKSTPPEASCESGRPASYATTASTYLPETCRSAGEDPRRPSKAVGTGGCVKIRDVQSARTGGSWTASSWRLNSSGNSTAPAALSACSAAAYK